jgi:hypothetical protein
MHQEQAPAVFEPQALQNDATWVWTSPFQQNLLKVLDSGGLFAFAWFNGMTLKHQVHPA